MEHIIRKLLAGIIVIGLIAGLNLSVTMAYFADPESSIANALQAWISSMWVQTTQADFAAGVLNDVDITTSSGDVRLASPSDWYHSDWGYRRAITIDHTKVQDVTNPSSTYADFPVLVYITGLSNVQVDGADIRFTSSDGVTELPREIESYSSGTLYAWVKTTLTRDSSDSSDDVIYMYYGNGSATEPPADSTYGSENVWHSSYQAVWHLNETSGIHQDATSNTNDGTPEGGVIQNATGKIAGADGFDSLDDYVDCSNSTSLNIRNAITLEAWINMNERPSTDSWYNILGKTEYFLYLAGIDETETLLAACFKIDGEGADLWSEGVADIGPSTWTHVVLTFDGTDIKGYVNGQHDWTKNKPGTIDDSSASDLFIGHFVGEDKYFNGIVDEARISDIARNANWIKTEHTNQDNPSGFCIVGGEVPQFTSTGTLASQVFDSGTGAAWYDSNWSYRRPISISPATSVANYQVLVTLTTAIIGNPYAGVNADGSDIRFTGSDGTTLQDYWIESWSNTGTSKIWVEVAASGTSTIYMYYGNAATSSASDGDATFVFFDDFDDTSLGLDWTFSQVGGAAGSYAESGTVIRLTGTDTGDLWGASDKFLFLSISGSYDDVLVESYTSAWGGSHGTWSKMGGVQLRQSVAADSRNRIMSPVFSATGATNSYRLATGGSTAEQITATNPQYNRVSRVGGASRAWYSTDGIVWTELGSQVSFTGGLSDPVFLGIHLAGLSTADHWVEVDWFRVRKYASSEPTTSVGSQELPDTTSWIGLSWDDTLQSNTDITFEVRASKGSFAKGDAGLSWTSVGGTSPVTSGLPSGRYMQWRATLTSSDPTKTPTLHEVIIFYD